MSTTQLLYIKHDFKHNNITIDLICHGFKKGVSAEGKAVKSNLD